MKDVNYISFAYNLGQWGGLWCGYLDSAKELRQIPVDELKATIEALGQLVGRALPTYSKVTEFQDADKIVPTTVTKITVAEAMMASTFLGDHEAYLKLEGQVYTEEDLDALLVEGLAHLHRIKKVFLKDDEGLDWLIDTITKLPRNNYSQKLVGVSLVGRCNEFYALELFAKGIAKRVINSGGYFEFVELDHPTPVHTETWE